ncbi:peptidase M15 [Niallia circulans]|uniref:Peptidase M15 n=2 Tax=Bacillaceae TaxID=186817 RepID=A0A268F9E2_NIACI|nr:peptidase M15 [Niallia circulans]AYV74644.1 peptidase M15 [Niallia circulans]NRG29211.1 M15 family metallopeptidase [Niallia circulans]PAD82005.1 peptidase M15 [Niallia circulans]QJX64849.1 M15 family metallopeptidase [Niallia circulans]
MLTGCEKVDLKSIQDKVSFWDKNEKEQEVEQPVNKEDQVKDEEQQAPEKVSEEEKKPWTLESVFFNDIKEVDGRKVIQNPTNIVSLVNKEFGLPDGYAPEDLVRPKVEFSFGNQDIEKSYMRKEAAKALEDMFNGAKKSGITLYAVSGYRSYNRQTEVYDAEVSRVGEEKAVQAVAYPGNSEHQTGLAMDISSESADFLLTEGFGETKEGKWLKENAHLYGFILRYPKGKEKITQYKFEPWHFRYVGKKSAKDIYENDWTLEEYFKVVRKI